jgi:uncharacterized protein with PQ loop repeat
MIKNKIKDKNKNGVDDKLDLITNVCSVILPFTTLDQLYLIYVKREVAGVSAITWFLYGLLSIPLLVYSLKRKDLPMILLNGLWVVFDWAVWLGVFLIS